MLNIPFLQTDNKDIDIAFRMATATLASSIYPFRDGILTEEKPVIIAGLGYVTPWTRDAAINTWNAGGILCPDVALDTLKSVLNRNADGYFIDGQYWDKIIWAVGAWNLYLYTGDRDFLAMAYEATVNTLAYQEKDEFDAERNLFRGPACYGDGVAAYGDIYSDHGADFILNFTQCRKELCAKVGVGMPMMALSTNCLYYYAYVLADRMAKTLGLPEKFADKAEKMAEAINRNFWDEARGTYRYYVDPFGGCDYQEGLGLSFAILFGVADEQKRARIFENLKTTPHGMPCVYPTFPRYESPDGMSFGRHSGTVWPHVQGFWADAAARCGRDDLFARELICQTENAIGSHQFAEIYHPLTGEVYGGLQERSNVITLYDSQPFQTWSATAYLRNILLNLAGMRFSERGLSFEPTPVACVTKLRLTDVRYRNAVLDLTINGNGKGIKSCRINGKEAPAFVPADAQGSVNIEITL